MESYENHTARERIDKTIKRLAERRDKLDVKTNQEMLDVIEVCEKIDRLAG